MSANMWATGPQSPQGATIDEGRGTSRLNVLQRQVATGTSWDTSAVLQVVGRGGGQPLAPELRCDMECRLGGDFSGVRIHTDAKAAASAEAMSAKAYTMGNEIVFGYGSFAPDRAEGRSTLAHELTHVRQQHAGAVSGVNTGSGLAVSDPSDAFEQEAVATADRALAHVARAAAHGDPSPQHEAATVKALSRPTLQRQGKAPVTIGKVQLTQKRVSIPLPAGVTIQASVPQGQTVKWSVIPGPAAVDTGTTVDATGVVTLGAGQVGGTVRVRADDPGGSGAFQYAPLQLVKKPAAVTATSDVGPARAAFYGGKFRHTVAPATGTGSECEGELITERFPSVPTPDAAIHKVPTPFGPTNFHTNDPGSTTAGWSIDSGGQMIGSDSIELARSIVDIGQFVANASNPAPKQTLPVSYALQQDLMPLEFPAMTWGAPFAHLSHVRRLDPNAKFVSAVNNTPHSDDYTGPAAVVDISPNPASVTVSPTAPKGAKGAAAKAPKANTVNVSAKTLPGGKQVRFSISSKNSLGCTINAGTGIVTVGSTAGTITVRATVGTNYHETTITITPPPAAPAAATPVAPLPGGPPLGTP